MTKSELGEIISRTFALYYFFKGLALFMSTIMPLVLYFEEYSADPYIIVLQLSSLLIFSLLAVIFWIFSKKIGIRIGGKDDKTISAESPEAYMTIIFVAFGCYFLTFIVIIAADLISYMFADQATQNSKKSELLETIIQLFIFSGLSLLFIFGARGLQRMVLYFRGMDK